MKPPPYSLGALALASLFTSSCGYIGGPLAPLINIPNRVSNLAAVQRGSKLIVQFGLPTRTTEGEPLNPPLTLDLRLADQHPKPTAVQDGIALYEIPCTDWIGKTATIEVKVVASNGKDSGWSSISLPVVAPPEVPRDIHAQPVASGIRLSWQSAAPHFRVLRAAEAKDAAYAMVVPDLPDHEWVDTSVEFGKTYRYLVQGFQTLAGGRSSESDLPDPISATAEAPLPGAPTALRAIAGLASIELSWDVPEGTVPVAFRIYRATADGDLVKIGESQGVPSYSDKTAEAGKVYRYAVAGVDAVGREGPKSTVVEATR